MTSSTPAIPYDAAGDVEAHRVKEAAWEGFAAYCSGKVAELQTLAAEQADHKLHRWYRRSRLWQRFPGLYEELHHKVRGAWDRELWGNYIAYRSRTVALPWNPSHGAVTEEKRKEIYGEVSQQKTAVKGEVRVGRFCGGERALSEWHVPSLTSFLLTSPILSLRRRWPPPLG